MASELKQITNTISSELAEFESRFRQSMKSKVPLLDTIMTYIVKRKGKQMRPMFVILSAKLFGDVNDRTFRGGALVELLHTATLVHDDVVDDAYKRRNFYSINALWKNKIAVLVGDYLLSKGLLLSVRNKDFDMLEVLSEAVEQISEGELLQIEKARRLDITEEIYFDIISKKTASLISSCCGIGTLSTTTDQSIVDAMKQFGLKAGIAFQIKDDLFDYGTADVGKPTGNDIKEKKMTLPLIYALNNASRSDKKAIISTVKNNNNDKKKVAEVLDYVAKSGGIEYAIEHMHQYHQEAKDLILGLDTNKSKTEILGLVDFVVNRKK
jgi:octaprenyl-diphosphate synthase